MINNTYISLHPSSFIRNDALNSIKHTLLLKYEIPHPNDNSKLIQEVMKNCQKCCQGLFVDDINLSNENIGFRFFGSLSPSSEAALTKNSLSFLDEFPLNKDIYPKMSEGNKSKVGFPTMILDHCVLSCYHAVLTELMSNKTVTAYDIINNIQRQGIHSLYNNRILTLHPEPIISRQASYDAKNSTKSSTASDFGRKAQSHINTLSSIEFLFKETGSNTTSGFFLQFADIFSHICAIDIRQWKFLSTAINESTKNDTLEKFEKLMQNLFSTDSKDPVDNLYRFYIIERISNAKLIACLLETIAFIEENTKYILCQEDIIDVLCLCQKLPNIFSRPYFIQYALEKLICKPLSYLDFWHSHRLDMSTSVLESSLHPAKHFQFVRWLEQFSLFCNYMAEYVIPIYEWCFTNMLMDAIEQAPLCATNVQKEVTIEPPVHRNNLLIAYNILSEYIQCNHKQIISPVSPLKKPNAFSFDTKTKHCIKFLNIPAGTIQQLYKLFFPYEELDLNLRQLSPDFFLNNRNNSKANNLRFIRNFYINLLFPG